MADLSLLNEMIGARVPIISCETREETRAVRLIHEMTLNGEYPHQAGKKVFMWDVVTGLQDLQADGTLEVIDGYQNPAYLIEYIKGYQPQGKPSKWGALFLVRDLHPFMDAGVIRALRNCANEIKSTRKTVILISPGFDIPPELAHDTDVFPFPLPDRDELAGLIARSAEQAPKSISISLDADSISDLTDSLVGMTEDSAQGAIGRGMVRKREFSRAIISDVLEQKAAHVRAIGLTFIKEKVDIQDVGGMDRLRRAIEIEQAIYQPGAREFGVESPKGILMFGPPGTGKSYFARAIAASTKPLFQLNLAGMLDSLYGASERNLSQALALAEETDATLWIDEFHHMFGGSGRQEDGGTTKRIIGKLLNWMQEQDSCYVVATANDISGIDPALLRAGRFDAIWFVDLPGPESRADILRIHLEKRRRVPADFDLDVVAAHTRGFGGAELEEIVKRAIRTAWLDQARPITTDDLVREAGSMTPLSVTMREQISNMRAWAQGRAQFASSEGEEDLADVQANRPQARLTQVGGIGAIEA
jgi:SpoVK/Ycf46/Vps4 family AAA+-type ATPase